MSEHTPDSAGRGKYSRVIRGLQEGIKALESQCDKVLAEKDAKIDDLVKALKLSRARIEYLGAACQNPKHFDSNVSTFLPAIDEVLEAVKSSPPQPDQVD